MSIKLATHSWIGEWSIHAKSRIIDMHKTCYINKCSTLVKSRDNGTSLPEMLNDSNLQWTYQSSTIRQPRCETNVYGDHMDKFRQNLKLICRQLTSLPIISWTFIILSRSLKIQERCLARIWCLATRQWH